MSDDRKSFKDLLLLQKITTIIACEQALGIPESNREVDPEFVRKALIHGHVWALYWQGYDNLLHETPKDIAKEVGNILTMWRGLEYGYSQLPAEDKDDVLSASMCHQDIRFPGFDGNGEASHLVAAQFMIDDLGRFQEQEGRELNSHWSLIEAYRRMWRVYKPYLGRTVSKEQMIAVFNAAKASPA